MIGTFEGHHYILSSVSVKLKIYVHLDLFLTTARKHIYVLE